MSTRLGIIVFITIALAGCSGTVMTSPTPTSQTVDVNTFTSEVLPGGSASREVTLTAAGQISATLTSTTPAGMVVGLGIGIPRANNQCALSSAINTAAGGSARIAAAADAGAYCVKIFDTGALTAPVAFTVSISRP